MRIMGAASPGGPEVLRPFEAPEPHAGPGEIRVRVHFASVNPADLSVRSGAGRGAGIIAERTPPQIPGMEAAGIVDEVGPGADRFAEGDEAMVIVLPSRPAGGAYAEFVAVPTASAAHVPRGVPLSRAATIPMNGLTAWRALDLLALAPGESLLVTGAAGALGGYVLQLARDRGILPIAVAEDRDAGRLRTLGAHAVIGRHDLHARLRAIAPRGVDGVIDGAVMNEHVLPFVRDGGAMASVRRWDATAPRGIRLLEVRVSDYAHRTDLLDTLRGRAEDGLLVPCEAEEVPAEDAADAHRRMETGGVRGRLVLAF
ncbi:zinc-binding dehydrogenase [Microbacterium sp. SYP-A9085]|uniref:NADP-dependent oxidoreductase n=1 Tax=Microbacterium sp. SYP-A9085 TaxID=2664454 RepID=UPI00129AAFAF|nr:NADP-dependent oxidoreductase [Microbacterium sp. SYP-A9085]MRH27774.1 zinc-binding dehydrogenase [Microbacterium sp. SYP-A9085]